MKIWALQICAQFEGCDLIGVFSSKEKAEKAKDIYDNKEYCKIFEITVDELNICDREEKNSKWVFANRVISL